MTSNGVTLARRIPDLVEAGLGLLNISLDTLIPQKYEFLTRRRACQKVWDCLTLAEERLDRVKVQ